MKKRLSTILLILIFLIGLSLLLYPTVSDYWNSLHQSRAIAEYAEQVANLDDDLYEGLWAAAQRYNETLLDKADRYDMTEEERAEYESLLGPGQAAESAAEDGGEPLHLLRADSGSPKGTGLLPGRPNPEAAGSPVDKGPHQGHQAPGEENKEGAAIQHVHQEGDLLQKSQVHLGKPHHWPVRGPLEGTLHLKQSPQEEDGEAPGKDV